jgi:ABC-type amino acid transport substrate-binding protein
MRTLNINSCFEVLYNYDEGNNMKCGSNYICALIFLTLCASCSSFAKTRFAYAHVPPYAYQDVNNIAQGLLIEKIQKIMKSIKTEVEFIQLPHRRLINFIEQGRVDLWAGQDNSQVNNELSLVSKTPLFIMESQVYWKTGTKRVNNIKDLLNKNLILISSYSYGGNHSKFVKQRGSIKYVINHEDGIDKLLFGNNEYLLGYKGISQEVIEKFHITGFQEASLAKYTLYIKLSKTYPNAAEVMKKIDAVLLLQNLANEN